jgi:hypothetical protein
VLRMPIANWSVLSEWPDRHPAETGVVGLA